MTWHVDVDLIGRYREGAVDRVAAASIEMHVTSCEECRGLVPADRLSLDRSWAALVDRLETPRGGWFERVLRVVGVRGDVARVLAVTPALRLSWLVALAVSVLFGVAAGVAPTVGEIEMVFLVVAPVVPVAGVALAFGKQVDPVYELTVAAPVDGFWLLLVRSVLVVGSMTAMLAVADIALGIGGLPGLWLVPALALSMITLVLAPRFGSVTAAGFVAAGWGLALAGYASVAEVGDAFIGSAQLMYLIISLAACVVLVVRRDQFRQGRVWL